MLNCDLSAICCCGISFSGCTFGARDAGGIDDVVTRLGRRVEDCDMRGCTFNGFKFGGEWVKVISTSHVTRHTSHVTRHTSHVTRHTSHFTRHTSHATRHTSHVTPHTSQVNLHSMRCSSASFKAASFTSCIMQHAELDA
jgi:uncharacterized protein YjbI with pentapeptide repeats